MHEWRHCESCDAALTDGLKGRIGPFFTSGGGTHRPNAATDLMAAKSPKRPMLRFARTEVKSALPPLAIALPDQSVSSRFEHFRDQHPHCAMADLLRRMVAMDTQHHGYANDFGTGLELAMARAFSSRKAK